MASDARHAVASDRWQLSRLPASLSRTAVSLVLLLSVVGAVVAWRGELGHSRDKNRVQAQRAAAALETIMRASGESLLGAQALGTGGTVDPKQFIAFASGVVQDSEFKSLFFARLVPNSQRKAFEKQLGQHFKDRPPDLPPGQFITAAVRAEYAPISQVWPLSATTPQSLGFDYLGDPIRGPAMVQSREVGAPRATDPLRAAVNGLVGWSVLIPVFESYSTQTAGSPATRGSLIGWIGGTIYGDEVGTKVARLVPDSTALRITDNGEQVYASAAPLKGNGATATVQILGRTLVVATDAGAGAALTWPALILLAGFSVAGFTARTFAVGASRARAIALANEELDRAVRSTSALQELTARLATSSSSADMAQAITSHLRMHEPQLLGSGVIMLAPLSNVHADDSIDELPPGVYEAILQVADETPPLTAEEGYAIFAPEQAREIGLEPAHVAVIPLTRGGSTAAALVLVFKQAQRFDAEQRLRLTTVGALGSQSLERALRYDEEHAMATSLQRSLLPQTLPEVSGIELAVRYIPAAETALVGGDWYDAFAVGSGLAFVVGDAVGHGVEAASAMGQIRSAMRVAMLAGESPSGALQVLDSFASQVPGASDATALVAYVDTEQRVLSLSRAGHIPPLLVRGGSARYLEDGGSLPLGWPEHERPLAQIPLEPGDLIVSLTDGVVERRDESLQDRLDQLAELCASTDLELDAMCDLILHRMGVERPTDDVALLIARVA